jgi:hypothetical protein
LDLPALLIGYNRPWLFEGLIRSLKAAAPRRIFVAIDGPKIQDSQEVALRDQHIDLVKQLVDWDAEIMYLVRDSNLGLRKAVSEAIDWFFEHVDKGIILEDDCHPHPDFFQFCEELLEKYENDERIFGISGDNSSRVRVQKPFSYGAGRYSIVWGWATWKSRWEKYDRNLQSWPETLDKISWLGSYERSYYKTIFDRLKNEGRPDSWAYPMTYTVLSNHGYWIFPSQNLISNVGFGKDSTHTDDPIDHRSKAKVGRILPLIHPNDYLSTVDQREFVTKKINPRDADLVERIWRQLLRIRNRLLRPTR